MTNEITDEKKIIQLVREIGEAWNETDGRNIDIQTARNKMIDKMRELVKIDFDQLQRERIVKKLMGEMKEELIKVISEEAQFTRDEQEVRTALEKLHAAIDKFDHGQLNWDQTTMQSVYSQAEMISNQMYNQIDINKGIEKVAQRIREIINAIEKEK